MRTAIKWSETPNSTDDHRPPIYSICYSPSGDSIIAACGVRVLVYDAATGSVQHSLKGHTDTVYCVCYAADGKSFASGGADRTVILWTSKGEGVLKYQHKESVQALAYNPVSGSLVSVAGSDYGIWSTEQPKVAKTALSSKGLCAAWSHNGQMLSIGLFDGTILFISSDNVERARAKRSAPIWTLAYSPAWEDGMDVLVVGSCDRFISFYGTHGAPMGKERELACEPCCISFYGNGNFMLVSAIDHKVSLFTNDGNMLVKVAEADDCVWCVHSNPKLSQFCCGANDGSISVTEIVLPAVYSIYGDQYVYRDRVTDAVVHQLTLDKRMRIQCNEYIQKLATYRDRIAAQLNDRFVIFEVFYDDEKQMRFQDLAHIRKKVDCNLLCVTFSAIVICCDRRLTLYDFQGNKRREWAAESTVCCLKVVGGAEGRECILLGLKNGAANRIFVDNPFASTLLKINGPVRSLDINCIRTKLAVIDDSGVLQVFDLQNKNEVLFVVNDAVAVSWNTEHEDMISYTTSAGVLNIKTGLLPPYQQKIAGHVVGFKANRVFNVLEATIDTVEVPHSHALYRYVEKKDFDSAYRIASLGVPESDWKMLGMRAMTQLRLDIARKAFINIREVKFVELLNRLELEQRQRTAKENPEEDGILMGNIMAFHGKYQEASRYFLKAGHENKAIDMFCDLKMWSDAKRVCSNESHLKELIRQQARWAEDSQNYVEAASLFQACGDQPKAISMMCKAGQVERLMEMCRALPKSQVALVTECANFFKKHKATEYAIYAFEKVGDIRSIICLHVETREWRRAFTLLERYPQYVREVYVPWANFLADSGNFSAALEAYRLAKWPKEAIRMMESLAANSVICRRFRDAAFYFIHLAGEYGVLEDGQQLTEAQWGSRIKLSAECVRRADIYYAFHFVYLHVTQPFPYDELTVLNAARFVVSVTSNTVVPLNVGRGEVLYTLAHVASQLDMTRTARIAYERLQSIVLPVKVMEQVDVDSLVIRSKGYNDKEELLDVCYRCKQTVPQLAGPGDRCPTCAHPFVRSFVRFENLPLVEFTLSNDLSDAEAERIIISGAGRKTTESKNSERSGDHNGWKASTGADVITFAEEDDNIDAMMSHQMAALGRGGGPDSDPFQAQLAYITRPGRTKKDYQPFVVNAEMLRRMRREEVFIVKAGFGKLPVQNKYYRLVNSNVSIFLCPGCQHFFKDEDYEYECMKGDGCPLCRYKVGKQQERAVNKVLSEILSKDE
ncbi:WD domain [Trypanosoma vivax]|uniref:Intraflagellar transport protein 122 homolog n=1 Tax=Trypanosoma vivax (strain Y486) TaxID=1055687 RepID=G0U6I7_TRYVY|nr:hypothetical protein TRVL_02156 [Trypanosoma vivax]KAH8611425.1 WD domain [Trypanosoma vivax]CCC51491.1 conserved hypothetical protein [Trypanosoma vivax Y486]